MRTYWLHSVWVLGFFLSLFSLQGKGGFPAPAPPPSRRGARGGRWSAARSAWRLNAAHGQVLRCARCPPGSAPGLGPEAAGLCEQTCCSSGLVGSCGTGVCVRVCVCVLAGVGTGARGDGGGAGIASLNSRRRRGVRCPCVSGADTTAFSSFRRELALSLEGGRIFDAPGTRIFMQNNPYRVCPEVGEGSGWRGARGWRGEKEFTG